nr:interleukin-17D [Odocoileus virginianus texanus]
MKYGQEVNLAALPGTHTQYDGCEMTVFTRPPPKSIKSPGFRSRRPDTGAPRGAGFQPQKGSLGRVFGARFSELLGGGGGCREGPFPGRLGEGQTAAPPPGSEHSVSSPSGRRGETGCLQARALLSRCPSSRGSSRAAGPADFPSSRGASFRSRRAARLRSDVPWARGCADRPEELLEQLYGRLAAGVLGAFHHTLQLGPREQARNASCPAGGRPADRRFRPPTNLRSVSPWAYRISYDPGRFPRYLPEAYCLCRGCLTGPRGEEDVRLRSAPVLVPAVVLRRTPGCAGGRAVYVEEYVTVPVGCTCVPGPEKDADAANSSLDKSARP